jgi:hypothetical protein
VVKDVLVMKLAALADIAAERVSIAPAVAAGLLAVRSLARDYIVSSF